MEFFAWSFSRVGCLLGLTHIGWLVGWYRGGRGGTHNLAEGKLSDSILGGYDGAYGV